MNEKLQAYKSRLEKQLSHAESEIGRYERSKSRILEKLKDVQKSYAKELNQGSVKVSKIEGVAPVKKAKCAPKAGLESDRLDLPTVEMDLSGPAAAGDPPEEKKEKSNWSLW